MRRKCPFSVPYYNTMAFLKAASTEHGLARFTFLNAQ
jgi:hypothetical protein